MPTLTAGKSVKKASTKAVVTETAAKSSKSPAAQLSYKKAAGEDALTKSRVIAELARSPHGALEEYLGVGVRAAVEDPEFFAHLIAWNELNGQIRDAKVALPVIQLGTLTGTWFARPSGYSLLHENALAHIAKLDPRNLVRATKFAIGRASHHQMSRLVKRYLREREKHTSWWDRTTVAHRESMTALYSMYRVRPSARADEILFKGNYPSGSLFEAIAMLSKVGPNEAAGLITTNRLPFLAVMGALKGKQTDPAIVVALIDRMSPTELVNSTKMLEGLGLNNNPALRAAYDEKLKEVAKSKKAAFKATVAAASVGEGRLAERLKGAQEKQADLHKVDGRWLTIVDKSGSMSGAIEVGRFIGGAFGRVAAESHMTFVDNSARYLNVTGKSYEDVQAITALISAGGGTSLGAGLDYLLNQNIEVDGIVLVSDGGENGTPWFANVYQQYCEKFGKELPIYFYKVRGDYDQFSERMNMAGIQVTVFDLTQHTQIDHYSLTNLIATMRSNKYSLVDEILATPLLTVDSVFTKGGNE